MRRNARRPRQPWRRRASLTARSVDPAEIVRELHRRHLDTLEDCRLAFEHQTDPLAVCVAVTKADVPRWLADAILLLISGAGRARTGRRGRTLLEQLWEEHDQDVVDATRAYEVAGARSHPDYPQTWVKSWRVAKHFVAKRRATVGLPPAVESPEAMHKSYNLVVHRLVNAGRYYWADPAFNDRLNAVLTHPKLIGPEARPEK